MDGYKSSDTQRFEKEIIVQPFSQRISTWPDDDWSGITDSKQRRRLQNRVNQRAKRLRNNATKSLPAGVTNTNSMDDKQLTAEDKGHSLITIGAAYRQKEPNERLQATHAIADPSTFISLEAIDSVRILDPDLQKTKTMIQHLEMMAHRCYTLGSPRTDLLLNLFQLNFTRAIVENIMILGLTASNFHDDAISPFNTAGPRQYDLEQYLPTNLRPTVVQRSVPHHPWLDLLPIPQMRDNLVLAQDTFDEEQLCLDMKGTGSARTGSTGIIVWRDPWDSSGWEVTEAFAHSWTWTIWNCYDLLKSTNYWRAQRNEKPLFHTR